MTSSGHVYDVHIYNQPDRSEQEAIEVLRSYGWRIIEQPFCEDWDDSDESAQGKRFEIALVKESNK